MAVILVDSQEIINLQAERDALFASLNWVVEFCNEHPEWFGEGTADNGAEFEWLDSARKLTAKP